MQPGGIHQRLKLEAFLLLLLLFLRPRERKNKLLFFFFHLKPRELMSWETRVAAPGGGDSAAVFKHLVCSTREPALAASPTAGAQGGLKGAAASRAGLGWQHCSAPAAPDPPNPVLSHPGEPWGCPRSAAGAVCVPQLLLHPRRSLQRPELLMLSEICRPAAQYSSLK